MESFMNYSSGFVATHVFIVRLVTGQYITLLKNNDQTRIKNLETGEVYKNANISEYAQVKYGVAISWARCIYDIHKQWESLRNYELDRIERLYSQYDEEGEDITTYLTFFEKKKFLASSKKSKEKETILANENYPHIFNGNIVTFANIQAVIEVCKLKDRQNGLTQEKFLQDKKAEEQEQEAYDELNF